MNKYTKWAAFAVIGVGLLGGAVGTARAGVRSSGNSLSISAVGRLAYGQLSDIRNSGDANEYFKCTVDSVAPGGPSTMNQAGAGITSVVCQGQTGAQQFRCVSTDPVLITAAQSIHGDSYVLVSWDQSGGNCTEISVENGSAYAPKY